MRQVLKYTAVAGSTMLVAGSCGVALGAAGEPTERVVTKTVEVEGPTETVTEEVEVEVKVPITPQACEDAIVTSEDIARQVEVFAEIAARYPIMVAEAYEAGLLNDMVAAEDILERMDTAQKDLNRLNGRMDPLVNRFNQTKTECRSQ